MDQAEKKEEVKTPVEEKVKLDRYGFIKTEKQKSKEELLAEKKDLEEESEKEKKWAPILRDEKTWKREMARNRNKIAQMVRDGIPETIRGQAWGRILDIDDIKMTSEEFVELYSREDSPDKDKNFTSTVNKDLNRSLPQIHDFQKKKTIEELKHVLYAYGFKDPELGYTQGMNFMAGLLLYYQGEEDAYKSLYQIMYGERTIHRDFFIPGFPRLEVANKMLEILLQKNYPAILKNLRKNNIEFVFFTSGWFMTAFMSFTWEPEFQMRIYERFLFYGLRGLLGLAMAIFSRHKDLLSKSQDMEILLGILQKPDESERMVNWHYVLKKWDEHFINKKQYLNLLREVGEKPEKML